MSTLVKQQFNFTKPATLKNFEVTKIFKNVMK